MSKADVKARIEALEEQLAELKEELEEEEACHGTVDVTDECEAELLHEGGTVRLALVHEGEVIIRSGAEEPLSLTSYAQKQGYSLAMGRKALRGKYFRVLKEDC